MHDLSDLPHIPRHLAHDELVFAPFDPSLLVELAREDDDGVPGLVEALGHVTEAAQACDCYVHFLREQVPPPLETALIGGGRFAVDVTPDGRVVGVELFDRLPCGSEEQA